MKIYGCLIHIKHKKELSLSLTRVQIERGGKKEERK